MAEHGQDAAAESEEGTERTTLPPPEWDREPPASAASATLAFSDRVVAIGRRHGPIAPLATAKARFRRLRRERAPGQEQAQAAADLGRLLVESLDDPPAAIKLARFARSKGVDPMPRVDEEEQLRRLGQLDQAGRLAMERAKAAGDAESWLAAGMLLCRAGDASRARSAFGMVRGNDALERRANEASALTYAWEAEGEGSSRSTKALLRAAELAEGAGDGEGAFACQLRAYLSDPADSAAFSRLHEVLFRRGRADALPVLVSHAANQMPSRSDAKAVAAQGASFSLENGDAHGALYLALIWALGDSRSPHEDLWQEVYKEGEMADLLAARLEVEAWSSSDGQRARQWEALGALCEEQGWQSADRASFAWSEALAADPSSARARTALREYAARTHERGTFVEALLRAGTQGPLTPGREACLRELADVARNVIGDPALALFVMDVLKEGGALSAQEAEASDSELAPRVRLQNGALEAARKALADTANEPQSPARLDALKRVAGMLRSRPGDGAEYIAVLQELTQLQPTEWTWLTSLQWAATRAGALGTARAAVEQRLRGSHNSPAQRVRLRVALARLWLREAEFDQALEALTPLFDGGQVSRSALGAIIAISERVQKRTAVAKGFCTWGAQAMGGHRALLTAVGAHYYLTAGDSNEASRWAAIARDSVPASPAAADVQTQALRGQASEGDGRSAEFEAAAGVLIPHPSLCEAAAEAFLRDGQPALALMWCQRWRSLTPLSEGALQMELRCAKELGSPSMWANVLQSWLRLPVPVSHIAAVVEEGLQELWARDERQAADLAQAAFDAFGITSGLLGRVCDRQGAGRGALGLAIRRYSLQTQSSDGDADMAESWQSLADRAEGHNHYLWAKGLLEAAKAGADKVGLLAKLQGAQASEDADAEICVLEARALCLSKRHPRDCAMAYRQMGALRWDRARDREGALKVWLKGAELLPRSGLATAAKDLLAFSDSTQAWRLLAGEAPHEKDPKEQAKIWALAGYLAKHAGDHQRCLDAALRALDLDPSRTDALALAEAAASDQHAADLLSSLYTKVASASMGSFGRRAAHYRGARQLERRGRSDLAVHHAVLAFEAVPSTGTTFGLMNRLAQRNNDRSEAVAALSRVASDASSPDAKSAWFRRAAALAGESEEGLRMRVDVLLRALAASPNTGTVEALGEALRDLLQAVPDAHEAALLRFEGSSRRAIGKAFGPEAARLCVAFAVEALRTFAHGELASNACKLALRADGDAEELVQIENLLPDIQYNPSDFQDFLDSVAEKAQQEFALVGTRALCLAASLLEAMGDGGQATSYLIRAAKQSPEDTAVVERARTACAASDDPAHRKEMTAFLPPEERGQAVIAQCDELLQQEKVSAATELLETAMADGELLAEDRDAIFERLEGIFRERGDKRGLRRIFQRQVRSPLTPRPRKFALGRQLADLLTAWGEHDEALRLVDSLLRWAGSDPEMLAKVVDIALANKGTNQALAALKAQLVVTKSSDGRLDCREKLARLSEESGDAASALQQWLEVAKDRHRGRQALHEVERLALHLDDAEALASVLLSRAERQTDLQEERLLRLRRAALLEQRLGRLEEARAELETLLEKLPDDSSALRFYADLLSRRGHHEQAAQNWRKALRHETAEAEIVALQKQIVAAFEAAGQGDEAAYFMREMSDGPPHRELLDLHVRLERAQGATAALGAALERQAQYSLGAPQERVELLLEAARLAEKFGDSTTALERTRKASAIYPEHVQAQLDTLLREYLARGAGTPGEARATLDVLANIRPRLAGPQHGVHAFLAAEALDVVHGAAAGLRELSARHAAVGSSPLIALGMAERLAQISNFEAALPLFDIALQGNLLGVRRRGSLALAAADCAKELGQLDQSRAYLEIAAGDEGTRAAAEQHLKTFDAATEPQNERQRLEDLSRRAVGTDRARILGKLATQLQAEGKRAEADQTLSQAIELANLDAQLTLELEAQREALRGAPRPESVPPPPAAQPSPVAESVRVPMADPAPVLSVAMTQRSGAKAADNAFERKTAPPPAAPVGGQLATPLRPPALPAELTDAATPSDRPTPINPEASPEGAQRITTRPGDYITAKMQAANPVTLPPEQAPVDGGDGGAAASPEATGPMKAAAPAENVAEPAGQAATPAPKISTPVPPATETPATAPAAGTPIPAPAQAAPSPPPQAQATPSASSQPQAPAAPAVSADPSSYPPPRRDDPVAVARKHYLSNLADLKALARLRDAANQDGNAAYARSLNHILSVFNPSTLPITPPALHAQLAAPELMTGMLGRGLSDHVFKAMELVWEGAAHLFRGQTGDYGVTGVNRVAVGGTSAVSYIVSQGNRLLSGSRTPVFHKRVGDDLAASVALLSPPAVVLAGPVPENNALARYRIGSALAAAAPRLALLFSLPESRLEALLGALVLAFGPADAKSGTPSRDAAMLAENLWQVLPGRSQRALGQLCKRSPAFEPSAALNNGAKVLRRAGLFVSGDIGASIVECASDLGIDDLTPLRSPAAYSRICNQYPELLDLILFAATPEYADARWQSDEQRGVRRPLSSGGFPIPKMS